MWEATATSPIGPQYAHWGPSRAWARLRAAGGSDLRRFRRAVPRTTIASAMHRTLLGPLLLVTACSAPGASSDTDTETDASSSSSSSSSSESSSSSGPPLCEAADIEIPRGTPIEVTGDLEPDEWDDAVQITIPVQSTNVNVALKHDGENLLVAYGPLAAGGLILFAEVLVDPLNDKTVMFAADDWWFHAREAEECSAQGSFDTWENCAEDIEGWEVNEGILGPPNTVEFTIPFELLGFDRATQCEMGLLLRVTNTQTVHEHFPTAGVSDEPSTWATVSLAP